jgi:hypothetical protein
MKMSKKASRKAASGAVGISTVPQAVSATGLTAIAALTAMLTTGCTHTAAQRVKTNNALAEESKALTTAVVDVLQSQPSTNRDAYTTTALAFAKQDQRVEGLPLKPFDVPALLATFGITNQFAEEVRDDVRERFAKEEALIVKRAAAEEKLIELGASAEETRNRRISRWTKFGVWGTTLIGGAIGLFVFCPIALPIGGRLLAWIVGKIPSLASAFGVVSVKAFDAVLRGIEKSKTSTPPISSVAPTVPVANTLLKASGDSRRGQENWIERLHTELSKEMDAAHKALVKARKAAVA